MKKIYLKPQTETLVMSALQMICDSPKPGQNEDVQYEDWDF